MIETESVRLLEEDENDIDDTDEHSTSSTTWAAIKTYTGAVDLPKKSVVLVNFEGEKLGSLTGGLRIKIGSYYVLGWWIAGGVTDEFSGFAILPAGTYDVVVEGFVNDSSIKYRNLEVGRTNFLDAEKINAQNSGDTVVEASSTVTLIDQNITIPSSRKTCLGKILKSILQVNCHIKWVSGTWDINDTYVELYIDDVTVSWTEEEKNEDGTFWYAGEVDPGQTINVKVKYVNNTASSVTVDAHVSMMASPWLLPNDYFSPLEFDVPPGTVIYMVAERLYANPTKYLDISTKRGIFQDNYWLQTEVSGTDMIKMDYTFDYVPSNIVRPFVKGFRGCISLIAADKRG